MTVDLLKDLKAKLRIDEHALEVAWRDQPDLFYQVANEHALALSIRDESKQDLEELEAEVDMELRRDAATSGEKTTETQIQSNKKTDKRVRAANDSFLEKRYIAEQWKVLRDAYEQRSFALSRLVELYIANYYSSNEHKTTTNANLKDIRAQSVKEVNRNRRVSAT